MPVNVTYTVEDGTGRTSLMEFNMDDGATIAEYADVVDQLRPLIQAVITGSITAASLNIPVALTGGVAAAVNSDVEEGALFIWNTNELGVFPRNRLPTFDEAKIIPGTRLVDGADADVIAFTGAITAGLTSGATNVQFVDYRGANIQSGKEAYEQFLKSRPRRR